MDEHMLGKKGVFIFSPVESQEQIKLNPNAGTAPKLAKAGYQALTEDQFDVQKHLKAPSGANVKIYVIYSGCRSNVSAQPVLATDTDAGETHLEHIASGARDDGDLTSFLLEDSVVYAVIA